MTRPAAHPVIRDLDGFRSWAASHVEGLTYVGADSHHAVGLCELLPGLRIAVADLDSTARLLRRRGHPTVAPEPSTERTSRERSTLGILGDPRVRAFMDEAPDPQIVVFKSSHAVELLCRERGWRVLAAPASIARRWENKLRFRHLARESGVLMPRGETLDLRSADLEEVFARYGRPVVMQAAHGYGGRRTFLVQDPSGLTAAHAQIRAPLVRVTEFVRGIATTVNACVTVRGIAIGAEILQLTGHRQLTPFQLGSCGNNWLAARELGFDAARVAGEVAMVGRALQEDGYSGLFGVDLVHGEDGRLVVIEVNPRLVASISMHTQLELKQGRLPLLARHLLSFLAPSLDEAPLDEHREPLDGLQLIAYHTAPEPAMTIVGLQTGVYPLGGGRAMSPRPGILVHEVAGDDEVLALGQAPGRVRERGSEWLRLQSPVAPAGSATEPPPAWLDFVGRLRSEVLGSPGPVASIS